LLRLLEQLGLDPGALSAIICTLLGALLSCQIDVLVLQMTATIGK